MNNKFSQADVDKCYTNYVGSYDNDMGAFEPRRAREELFRAMGAFKSCVELGAGTGRNVGYFPLNSNVTLLDINEEMLKKARARIGVRDNFRVVRADSTASFLGTDEFDAGVFTYAFSGMLDPEAALHEMERIVGPAGKIGILDFDNGIPSGVRGNFGDYRLRELLKDKKVVSRKEYERPFGHRNILQFVIEV